MNELRNDGRNRQQESVSVKRFTGSAQICSVWLPGSSINLAGGSRVYLVQQAADECWLTGCYVICTSDVVWHKESQGPANTHDLPPEQMN